MAWQFMNFLRYTGVRFIKRKVLIIVIVMVLAGCVSSQPFSWFTQKNDLCILNGDGYDQGDVPIYQVDRRNYFVLMTSRGYQERGIASWYGPNFHGKMTSSGEVYDMNGLTAAHKTLPMQSRVRVTNLDNRQSIILRVNDRGPFVNDRIIDLSREAADRIGLIRNGTARVEVEAVPNLLGSYIDQGVSYFAQTGTYQDENNAKNAYLDLREKRFSNVNIISSHIRGNRAYQVRIGPLESGENFLDTQSALSKQGYKNVCLVVIKS
jgi:rare lipoprotein A